MSAGIPHDGRHPDRCAPPASQVDAGTGRRHSVDDAQGGNHRRVQVNDTCHRSLELLATGSCRHKVGVTGWDRSPASVVAGIHQRRFHRLS